MTLPASGAIDLGAIRNEFKAASGAVSLSEMYRSGTYVPPLTANAGIPTSGAIQMDDFYSATITCTPDASYDESWVSIDNGACSATLTVKNNGNIEGTGSGSGGAIISIGTDPWVAASSAPGAWYEVYVSVTSGTAPSGTLNTWLALTSDSAWTLSVPSGPDFLECYLSVKFRHKYIIGTEYTTTVYLGVSSGK